MSTKRKWKKEITSLDHGPLTSSGFKTFCHLCRHCTSVLSLKHSASNTYLAIRKANIKHYIN